MSSREAPFTFEQGNLAFALDANGYKIRRRHIEGNGIQKKLKQNTKHLETVFRTPNFTDVLLSKGLLEGFNQQPVRDAVGRFRKIDEAEARRISFLLGGVARSLTSVGGADIPGSLAYIAEMISLGERRSGEAIAAALGLHVLLGEPLTDDPIFKGDVYRMAEAIAEDPIIPRETEDLGLSQAARLLGFFGKRQDAREKLPTDIVPEVLHPREVFASFPTIGAEFHLSPTEEVSNRFWQRVAILNMSQYQSGSHIPFSRTEEGLLEIRMDPSIYPVSTSNWNLMRLLLPELHSSYFTMTVNRKEIDFGSGDSELMASLHGLGNLCYAAELDEVPSIKTPQQVNFGDWYLGQTVRVREGKYSLTGHWGGGAHGHSGQLNICSGYGNLFENLAFYLSMAVAEPAILKSSAVKFYIQKAANLDYIVKIEKHEIWNVFEALNSAIMNDKKLALAVEAAEEIEEKLKP